MMNAMRAAVAGAAALWLASGAAPVPAQGAYPVKPLRLIAPFPPEGTTDTLCRLLAQKLSEALGQQVIVENRPGAGGNLGHELAAKAAPDGYTLVLSAKGALVTNQFLYKRLGFDPCYDFVPISLVATSGPVLVIHPSVPALPEVPAMAEAGVKQKFPQTWWAVTAPRGTPPAVIQRLDAELGRILEQPHIREKYTSLGLFPVHSTPERVLERIKLESPQMAKILEAAGVQPQ
jgi:tripartite-type tricarboxylate transporter receptor subunit TctC